MIDPNIWVNSLPKNKIGSHNEKNQLDSNRWINTIPKKNTNNSIKKYSITTVLFIAGLLIVSIVKNETRNLQKEINNLQASINITRTNLKEAKLDHEVITSPENLSKLAKEHLEFNLVSYKKNQIIQFDKDSQIQVIKKVSNHKKIEKEKSKDLTSKIKSTIIQKVEKQKTDIKKFQKFYSKPKLIPKKIKTKISQTVKKQSSELKKVYSSPKEVISFAKVQKWTAIQIVKVFLGIPIVPGR